MEKPSSIYSTIVAKGLFPLLELMRGRKTVSWRKFLELSQWWDEGRIKNYQGHALKNLLLDTEKVIPYYKNLFKKNSIGVKSLSSINDVNILPLIDKKMIKQNYQLFLHPQYQSLLRDITSCHSGDPLNFYVNNKRLAHDLAAHWRAMRWWDIELGDSICFLENPWQNLTQGWFKRKLLRVNRIQTEDFSARIAKILKKITKGRPKVMIGTPTQLFSLAEYAMLHHIAVNNLGIQVAFTTGEVLDEFQRDKISEAFGCRVANVYYAKDVGFIAHECPAHRLHINAENLFVEIVDSNGNAVPVGEIGEVAVTQFSSAAFPFIRYRTGDFASMDKNPCSCGRKLPVFKTLEGKKGEIIYSSANHPISRYELIRLIMSYPNIEKFKFIQKSPENAALLLRGSPLSEYSQQKLGTDLRTILGSQFDLEIAYVQNFEDDRSGKFKALVGFAR